MLYPPLWLEREGRVLEVSCVQPEPDAQSSTLGTTLPDHLHCSFVDNMSIKWLPILDSALSLREWVLVHAMDGIMSPETSTS